MFQELKTPVVRYPGGNFVATYHWYEGVGAKDNRPARQANSAAHSEVLAIG